MSLVEHGQTYKVVWENVEHIVNMSYSAGFYDMRGGGVVITHNVSSRPDQVYTIPRVMKKIEQATPAQLAYNLNIHGDFYFNGNDKELSYLGRSRHLSIYNG